jgi:hypothetical protein
MTVQHDPVFPQSMKTAQAVCTAAKTTYNDTANAVLLWTAGADGSLIKRLSAIPRATVTATQLQLYISKDAGVTLQLIDSELMLAYTMVQTSDVTETKFGNITEDNPLRLAANDRLYVATGVALAGGIVFQAQGEDF